VLEHRIDAPAHDTLVADFEACIRDGSNAIVQAPHLPAAADGQHVGVRGVLESLLERARQTVDPNDAQYLELVADVIRHGSLAERIRARLEPHASNGDELREAARAVYGELADCLLRNEPWSGRWQPAEQALAPAVYLSADPAVPSSAASSRSAAGSMR
jgi:hypothetical protein